MFSRKIVYAVLVVCFALGASTPALAGKGGGGNNSATITFANASGFAAASSTQPRMGSSVAFSVSANLKASDANSIWLTNYCTQNGVTVYAESHGAAGGYSGPFTLNWPGGGSAQCTAYAWIFPNAGSWIGTMTYSAAG